MGERTHYSHGTFCWVGLATSDPVGATDFYASMFGWEGEELSAGGPGSYTLLRRKGKEVALLYRQTSEARAAGAPPHWTSYISVEDADATAARAGELGGAAVFREPFDVLDEGRVAAIRDPMGAIVSLWQPRSRHGAALVDEPGAPCWNELRTTDVERSGAFYGDLLGWRYQPGDGGYTTIMCRGSPNGGMRLQTGREQGAAPDWLPYFTVDDADRAAGNAERHGGRSLAPAVASGIGRAAVLADPQGAQFAVLRRQRQFTNPRTREKGTIDGYEA
jgi:uncharacterized protein